MSASTQRAVVRWLHIIASVPILGYIYGPLEETGKGFVRVVVVPLVVVSGLWLWKGHWLRRSIRSGLGRIEAEGGAR